MPGGILAAEQGQEPYQAAADDVFAARAGEIILLYEGLQEAGELQTGGGV